MLTSFEFSMLEEFCKERGRYLSPREQLDLFRIIDKVRVMNSG